jgi:Uma2 family endonuclease
MGMMNPVDTSATLPRPFIPGTPGWAASDLDDPVVERLWFQGRYEIVNGVLTTMAPAYYSGGKATSSLQYICLRYLEDNRLAGSFGTEVDIIIDDSRVVIADTIHMSDEDEKRQAEAVLVAGRIDGERTRILVPPTLIIETISPGHERHDRITKMRWYAEFKVPNYWILDPFAKTLDCYVLDGAAYRLDSSGKGSDEISTRVFPGLVISLKRLWGS